MALTPYEVIKKKRDGGVLSRDEIRFMIEGITKGTIPDYVATAFIMAAFIRGLDDRETTDLTIAMMESGDRVDLSGIPGETADKHSTGGVGDKISLPLAPLVAAAGVYVPMMSGRGLGHTGGTLDKLEAIPGFRVDLDERRFVEVVRTVGCAIIGQTGTVAPADKKMYALRDVTATVDSIPLIAGSILSKKLAAGPKNLVLDVKTGSGAFMVKMEDSRALAETMVAICRGAGRRAQAVISDMDQPLGRLAGNAVEIVETIEVLRGGGPADVVELTLDLGARMLVMAGAEADRAAARRRLEALRASGAGLRKFAAMIEAQGGDPRVCDDRPHPGEGARLPRAAQEEVVRASRAGFVAAIDTFEAGMAIVVAGGGRRNADDRIDPAVGVEFVAKVGDPVGAGDALCRFLFNDAGRAAEGLERLRAAYRIAEAPPPKRPLVHAEIV